MTGTGTADVRFQWTEQAALQQRIRTSEEELEQLKEKYRSLSVGLGQLERMQVQCREQWEACETYLSGVQEKVPVYESLQSLSALSDQIQHALLQSEDYRKGKSAQRWKSIKNAGSPPGSYGIV